MNHQNYLTAQGVADRWKKPVSWVYANWQRLGIPAIKLGQAVRFRAADIERWEESHRG